MYENTPNTILQWVPAVPGHIPHQAVIYGKSSRDNVMYVVKLVEGSTKTLGLYETNRSCAEYLLKLLAIWNPGVYQHSSSLF